MDYEQEPIALLNNYAMRVGVPVAVPFAPVDIIAVDREDISLDNDCPLMVGTPPTEFSLVDYGVIYEQFVVLAPDDTIGVGTPTVPFGRGKLGFAIEQGGFFAPSSFSNYDSFRMRTPSVPVAPVKQLLTVEPEFVFTLQQDDDP